MGRVLGRELDRREFVDHIDRDGLNNTRANLRIATHAQNKANSKVYKNNAMGIKGVRDVKGRYRARIKVNRKDLHLGFFDTPEEAHEAYKKAAIEHFGEFARFE